MRLPLLLSLLAPLTTFAASAFPGPFTGAWTGHVCPLAGMNDLSRCSSFFLQLYQKNGRLCGTHLFATAGAKQMDEGGTPSILAQLEDRSARGEVESTRASPAMRIPVTLLVEAGELRWQRTENPPGDYLLPRSITLTRSQKGSMLSASFEQRLAASCSAYLDMPQDKPPPPKP